jgi:hypothetical protein
MNNIKKSEKDVLILDKVRNGKELGVAQQVLWCIKGW